MSMTRTYICGLIRVALIVAVAVGLSAFTMSDPLPCCGMVPFSDPQPAPTTP